MASPAGEVPVPMVTAAAASSSSSTCTPSDALAAGADHISAASLVHAVVAGQHQHGAAQGDREEAGNMEFTCKWKTNSYDLVLPAIATVGFLKHQIALLTNVRSHHQKLILKPKNANQKLTDDLLLEELQLKPKAKFMMIGNEEKDLILDDATKGGDIVDDLGQSATTVANGIAQYYDYRPSELLALQTSPAVREKVEKCWLQVRDTFTLINPLRAGKKLLVLDLDYTLFDMKTKSDDWRLLRRPGTHRFLTAMYAQFDLVVWSQTSWRWLELKLTELGILTHPAYKVSFVMDKSSMFRVASPQSDGNIRKHHVKCLEIIWRKYPQYSSANTVHVDDLGRNFALNPQSGLKIAPYKNAPETRATDRELSHLTRYLTHIATTTEDFNKLDHSTWREQAKGMEASSSQGATH